MATIVAAHDLSGIGRCSLTTALAVLPAMGHHCRPLPTAVLSMQTGLPGYSFWDFTGQMPLYLDSWRTLGMDPDMIYTGFLGSGRQAELLGAFIGECPRALVVVDPVLGDHGALYDCYDASFVGKMRELAAAAHIIVPNATELLLLAGAPADGPLPEDAGALLALVRGLHLPRLEYAVITGASRGGRPCNLLVAPAHGEVEALPCRHSGVSFSGAGDLFASVLSGSVAGGADPRAAVALAADFVTSAAGETPAEADPRLGLRYEALLSRLARETETGERRRSHA